MWLEKGKKGYKLCFRRSLQVKLSGSAYGVYGLAEPADYSDTFALDFYIGCIDWFHGSIGRFQPDPVWFLKKPL